MIGGRLIHMLRVTVIFPFARSAMPALQTLMEGAAACLISAQRAMAPTQKRVRGLVVPPLGRARHTAESLIEPPLRRQGKTGLNGAHREELQARPGGSGLGYDAAAGD